MSHKCCVLDCEELVKETRAKGLPLHKFPKDPLLRIKWLTSGGFSQDFKPTNSQIVCYKHFKQHDYEIGRSHKLFLKKGSVPSVFANYQQHPDPITPESNLIVSRLQAKLSAATINSQAQAQIHSQSQVQTQALVPTASEFPDVSPGGNLDSSCSSLDVSMDSSCSMPNGHALNKPTEPQLPLTPSPADLLSPPVNTSTFSPQLYSFDHTPIPSSFPSLVHPQPTATMKTKTIPNQVSTTHSQQQPFSTSTLVLKKTMNSDIKLRTYSRTDLTFLPGSKLEAKDFNEKWYSARVVETDWGEREVLIHFDKWSSRFDEWIPMDSSRLRTLQLHSKETKPKEFIVGERILATWVDGKKYPAKVNTVLGNDKYDVLFDDGYSKVLKASKMTKLLELPPNKQEEENTNYLGSKQERRDKKRKHTVTELFYHKKKVKSEPDKIYKKLDSVDTRNVKYLSKTEPGPLVKTEALPRLDNHQNVTNSVGLDEDYATYIGNLRVEIEDSTYKCPKTGCIKNFRKENLLQMHIKHYHPEYSKLMGSTPNVADLAYARTIGESIEDFLPRKSKSGSIVHGISSSQVGDIEFTTTDTDNRLESKFSTEGNASTIEDNSSELSNSCTMSPGRLFDIRSKEEKIHTGIKTLPPVRQPVIFETDNHGDFSNILNDNYKLDNITDNGKTNKKKQLQYCSDTYGKVKKSRGVTENDESFEQYDDSLPDGNDISDLTCHSISNGRVEPENEFTHCKTGEVMIINGEVIKVEKLKREEIINCTCGITEEDGLMIQCDLCLCWQHGHCNAIEKEKDVPEKYVCYICQHSHRQRTTKKYFHDQEWIKEGKLPSIYAYSSNKIKVNERTATLKRSCDLIASLLQIRDLLYSLRVKVNVAQNKDHQKLYLWAKNWSKIPVPTLLMEPVPIIEIVKTEICSINENMNERLENNFLTKQEDDHKLITSDTELMQILEEDNSPTEDAKLLTKNFSQNNCKEEGHILLDALTKNVIEGQNQQFSFTKSEMNNGISTFKQNSISRHITSEKLHKISNISINSGNKFLNIPQPVVPEPEAPIDPVECKLRLLEHIDNFQNYLDSTLNFVETQLSALEEMTEKYNNSHVQIKQTMQMLLNDLDSIRKLAALC
ncbi:uncharacterized protein LOC131675416 [Phymastichus coffea]|uniref:uncharacterized protein LOC131675416 n=1 Tax=Phymastichus coffea TaxID=108790 RepID=UPI00273A86E6|nr:uncharacterized protein LOC131675416 [Phymastichus coffea]